MAKSKPVSGADEDLIESILWEISAYLDKKKWWRQWLRYLVFGIGVPIAYLIGWVACERADC